MSSKTAKRWIGIGKESVYGTLVAATRVIEGKENIVGDPGWYIPKPILRRAYQTRQAVMPKVDGNLELDAKPDTIGELLYGALGGLSTSNPYAGVYTHTFTPGTAVPSYTVRLGQELTVRNLAGILVQKLTFKFGASQPTLQAIATVMGCGIDADTSTFGTEQPTDSQFSARQFFTFDQLSLFQIAGVDRRPYLFDGEISFENVFPVEKMRQGGSKTLNVLRVGERRVTGKLSMAFDDTVTRNQVIAQTGVKIQAKFEGETIASTYKNSLDLILYECNFVSDGSPHVQPIDEPYVLNLPFQAFYTTADAKECQVALQNAVTSY